MLLQTAKNSHAPAVRILQVFLPVFFLGVIFTALGRVSLTVHREKQDCEFVFLGSILGKEELSGVLARDLLIGRDVDGFILRKSFEPLFTRQGVSVDASRSGSRRVAAGVTFKQAPLRFLGPRASLPGDPPAEDDDLSVTADEPFSMNTDLGLPVR
jgi:hypothetical protein